MKGVPADHQQGGLIPQKTPGQTLLGVPLDHGVLGPPERDPSQPSADGRPKTGEEKGELIAPNGQHVSGHQQALGITGRGTGNKIPHRRAPFGCFVTLGEQHEPCRI